MSNSQEAPTADSPVALTGLYTSRHLAEVLQVPVAWLRTWYERGWLIARCEVHRLAYFDFDEVAVARRLTELRKAGLQPKQIGKLLMEITNEWPNIERPLLTLPLVVEGKRLLVRRPDEQLMEPRGQLRIDFAALEPEDSDPLPATISLSKATVGDPEEESPAQLLQLADELADSGNLAQAIDMVRSALAADGPRPERCFQLAELLYRLGDLPAARERYFMAIELDPDFVEARANLGCLLAEMGERDLAVAAFEGALRFHPDYADVHYQLARTLDEVEQVTLARFHWQRFLELSPDSPWAEEATVRLQS